MNYYEHHIGDYAAATAHLSLIEDALFSRMLRRYYLQETPLPGDVAQVARLCGARSPDEVAAVGVVLDEFFHLEDDGWHNKRADEEIERYRAKVDAARENGKKGGRPPKKPKETQPFLPAFDLETQPKAHQTPDTNHQEEQKQKRVAPSAPSPSDLFPDVDPGHLRDWVAARKAKKLPLTETAAKGFRRAAEKAGMSVADAVKFCAEKGWAGLHADFAMPHGRAGPPAAQPPSKTLAAIQKLQGMKHGNVDPQRNHGRPEPPALPEP
ncbi:YdaU family protein [Pseudoxanthomonas sp. JBR18]|nr:YdaU family protein [Pseudoxanthomonas sp. JBR18]WCE06529.1 YdaU family protein [Pseudoxanthomonas sp. JBR18]